MKTWRGVVKLTRIEWCVCVVEADSETQARDKLETGSGSREIRYSCANLNAKVHMKPVREVFDIARLTAFQVK